MRLKRPQGLKVITEFNLELDLIGDFVAHHGPAAESVEGTTAIDATMEEANHMVLFLKESFQTLSGDNAKVRSVHELLIAQTQRESKASRRPTRFET
jgi:hypothetical protein